MSASKPYAYAQYGKLVLVVVVVRIYGRVRTLLSCLNCMTSHDFFHDLFKFSKTLGVAVSFKNSNPELVVERFLTLNSSKDKLWSSPSAVNNLSNRILIFHDFQVPSDDLNEPCVRYKRGAVAPKLT